jgi:hypothetical protein
MRWNLLETILTPRDPNWDNLGIMLQNWEADTASQEEDAGCRMEAVKSAFSKERTKVDKAKVLKYIGIGIVGSVATELAVAGLGLLKDAATYLRTGLDNAASSDSESGLKAADS